MPTSRWATYDEVLHHDLPIRTRVLALVLAGTVAVGVSVLGSVSVGRAADVAAVAPVQLTSLALQRNAELQAIKKAYADARAAIEADHAQALAAVDATLRSDLAAAETSDAAAAARAEDQRAAALAAAAERRSRAETAVMARFDRDRASIAAFFTSLSSTLGPEGSTPPKDALEAAKKSLESRRAAELGALDAAQRSESAALAQAVAATLTALDQEAARRAAEARVTSDAAAALTATEGRRQETERADALRTLEEQDAELAARHAQELTDLDGVHDAQTRGTATAATSARDTLAATQKRERDALRTQQATEKRAQAEARTQVQRDNDDAARSLEQQAKQDAEATKATYDLAVKNLVDQRAAAVTDGAARVKALEQSQATAVEGVKATYSAAIGGLPKGRAGLSEALTARLARVTKDQTEALAALAGTGELDLARIEDTGALTTDANGRRSKAARDAAKRVAELAKARLGRSLRAALLAAKLDRDRRVRLASSDYYTLRLRAIAFLANPGAFSSVTAAYDPATDPGSPYNVGRRIGIDKLPSDVTGKGVDVALLDTGVVDVPGLAEADVQIGPDFSFEDGVPDLRGRDTMGHGTHLAGLINARDPAWVAGDHTRTADRFLGVAPDARVISVKAGAADGAVDVTQIIAGINWVIANKDTEGRHIRVLNLSFGTDGVQDYRVDPLTYAVERAWKAGIVVVVAGGNDGWATPQLTNPAQDPYVLAVGASQTLNGKESIPTGFSNGSVSGRTVDLAAPGRSLVSLRNPGSRSDEVNAAGRAGSGDRFVRASGTSQAAAVTSGAVALLLSARPDLSPDQVKAVLTTSADPARNDKALAGSGYLRVDQAVATKSTSLLGVAQTWEPATGTGTVDGARGSVRVVRDGLVLEGQLDIFGRDFSGATWSEDSWTGSRWTAGAWTGAKWSGAKWSDDAWSGTSWTGAKWSGAQWTGAKWSGATWSSDGFSGAKWSGAKWSAGGWFGAGWGDGPPSSRVVLPVL